MDKLQTMSKKEVTRMEVMQRIEAKRLKQKKAAEMLRVSERHIKRLLRAYRQLGTEGLVSKRRGKPSNNQLKRALKQQAIDLIYSQYPDFGPTLAHEKLTEKHGLELSRETVRKLMITEGIWKPKKTKKLVVHQLVFAEGLQRVGDTTRSCYRFRHALYQRHLYQNLDAVMRARLHQTTGEALEANYIQLAGDMTSTDDKAPRLAFHFENADLIEKAIHYHQIAGEQAYHLAANEEAIFHYNQALELLNNVPKSSENIRQELLILITLSGALNAARGYAEPELRRLYARAGELAAKGDEVDLYSHVFYLRGIYHYARAEYQSTLDMGEQLLRLYLEQSIPWMSDIANLLLGISKLNTGDLARAQAHLQKIEAVGDSDQVDFTTSPIDRDRLLFPVFLSWTLWLLGYPDQALDLNQQLLSRVRKLGNKYIEIKITKALKMRFFDIQNIVKKIYDKK